MDRILDSAHGRAATRAAREGRYFRKHIVGLTDIEWEFDYEELEEINKDWTWGPPEIYEVIEEARMAYMKAWQASRHQKIYGVRR